MSIIDRLFRKYHISNSSDTSLAYVRDRLHKSIVVSDALGARGVQRTVAGRVHSTAAITHSRVDKYQTSGRDAKA